MTTTTVLPNSSRRRRSACSTTSSLRASSSAVGSSASTSGASPRRRGGDRDPLLLAAGERAGALPLAPLQVERVERALRRAAHVSAAGEPQPERDVLARAQIRPEVAALEDERDLARPVAPPAPPRRAARASARRRRTSPADGLVETGGEMQRRALARARRPEQRDELAAARCAGRARAAPPSPPGPTGRCGRRRGTRARRS